MNSFLLVFFLLYGASSGISRNEKLHKLEKRQIKQQVVKTSTPRSTANETSIVPPLLTTDLFRNVRSLTQLKEFADLKRYFVLSRRKYARRRRARMSSEGRHRHLKRLVLQRRFTNKEKTPILHGVLVSASPVLWESPSATIPPRTTIGSFNRVSYNIARPNFHFDSSTARPRLIQKKYLRHNNRVAGLSRLKRVMINTGQQRNIYGIHGISKRKPSKEMMVRSITHKKKSVGWSTAPHRSQLVTSPAVRQRSSGRTSAINRRFIRRKYELPLYSTARQQMSQIRSFRPGERVQSIGF